jgi:uncharacterized membrane protein HdeD (DUF308 family)
MLSTIMQSWWILLLRGISATVFGVSAIVWPRITLLMLVIIYGAVALIDGIAGIALTSGVASVGGPGGR